MLIKIDIGVQELLETVAPGAPDLVLGGTGGHLVLLGELLVKVVPVVDLPVIHPGNLLPAGELDRQIGVKGNILLGGGVIAAAADIFQEIVDGINGSLGGGRLEDNVLIKNEIAEAVGVGGILPGAQNDVVCYIGNALDDEVRAGDLLEISFKDLGSAGVFRSNDPGVGLAVDSKNQGLFEIHKSAPFRLSNL